VTPCKVKSERAKDARIVRCYTPFIKSAYCLQRCGDS